MWVWVHISETRKTRQQEPNEPHQLAEGTFRDDVPGARVASAARPLNWTAGNQTSNMRLHTAGKDRDLEAGFVQ